MNDRTPKIYLSRRNLVALLAKLDAEAAGETTSCSIIKHQSPSPAYRQTMDTVMVIAVDDEEYYSTQQRSAGEMHPREEEQLAKPSTGIELGGDIFGDEGTLVLVQIRPVPVPEEDRREGW